MGNLRFDDTPGTGFSGFSLPLPLSGEPLCDPADQGQMKKLLPFSLNHCEKPSDQAQSEAYRRNVGRTDAQEYERSPEQVEN